MSRPEQDLEDALRRQVDHLHDAPITLESVQRRARGIRRRRTALAVAAAATAVAVVVPVGLSVGRPDSRPTLAPPSVVTGAAVPTYTVDTRPPEDQTSGEELRIPSWVGGRLVAPDRSTLATAGPVQDAVLSPDGGWSGEQLTRLGWSWTTFDSHGRARSTDPGVQGQVGITPDGSEWAYLAMTKPSPSGSRLWTANLTGGSQSVTSWAVPGDITGDSGVAGILSDSTVVVTGSPGHVYLARSSGSLDALPGGALKATTVSTATGAIAVQTSSRADGTSCWAVVDSSGSRRARTCTWALDQFSADGRWLVAHTSYGDGAGPGELAILDAATLRPVAEFRAPDSAYFGDVVWEGDDVIAPVWVSGVWYVERLGQDGITQVTGFGERGPYAAAAPIRFGAGPLTIR